MFRLSIRLKIVHMLHMMWRKIVGGKDFIVRVLLTISCAHVFSLIMASMMIQLMDQMLTSIAPCMKM